MDLYSINATTAKQCNIYLKEFYTLHAIGRYTASLWEKLLRIRLNSHPSLSPLSPPLSLAMSDLVDHCPDSDLLNEILRKEI